MSMRTHYAGSLRASDEGAEVALCGWVAHRRDHGGVVFIDLRDREGIVQVVLDPGSPGCAEAHRLRSEYVIRVEGTVRPRPEGMVNTKEATGEIEVGVAALEVLNEAEPPPFPLDDRVEVDETLRLRHRYLDLRRPRMAANLITRAKLVSAMRAAMDAAGFIDVETPTLTRSTPEGARDFLVPVPAHARHVLRPAPVAPAVQADADGGRPRPLLPGGPLLARRGPPRRPPAGVHPARRRGQLRRPGGHPRPHRGGGGPAASRP